MLLLLLPTFVTNLALTMVPYMKLELVTSQNRDGREALGINMMLAT
jgi:hypothetical protein